MPRAGIEPIPLAFWDNVLTVTLPMLRDWFYLSFIHNVVQCRGWVLKMGKIVPRAGIEHIPLAFWDNVLTITPPMLRDFIAISTSTCLCANLF